MWISREAFVDLRSELKDERAELREVEMALHSLRAENKTLDAELSRLRNDLKWFMHRLNQVEMERAALVFQATGTRIAAPQFKTEPDPSPQDILNAMGAPFAGVGEDSPDPADQLPEQNSSEDYTHLPGYKGNR